MSKIHIREAELSDIPALLELSKELDISGEETMPLEEAERLFNKISDYPDYTIYIAEIEEEPVGTYALLIMDKLEHGGAPSGIIDSVSVDASFQRMGIGKTLMSHAREMCKKRVATK